MKFLIKLLIILSAFLPAGCWDMYNEAADDLVPYNYYIAIGASSNIKIYSLDSNGIPTLSSTEAFTSAIYNIAAHPSGKYIYVPDYSNKNLYVYQVNDDATISQIDVKNTGLSDSPYSIKVDPAGKFVYVSTYLSTNSILIYSIGSDGKLTSAGSTALSSSTGPKSIVFHPSGKKLYIALSSGGGFAVLTVNTDGSLSSPVTISVSNDTYDIVIHPNGQYLYVSAAAAHYFYKYDINADGSINASSKVTYDIGTSSTSSVALTINPNGNYLYVKDGYSSYILAYRLGTNGLLTLEDQSPESIGSGICSMIIHPGGRYIYFTDKSGGNRFNYNIVLNNSGAFNQTYLHKDFSDGSTSNPVFIRKK